MTITDPARHASESVARACAPGRPSRHDIVELLQRRVWHTRPQRGLRSAWQGRAGAVDAWCEATGAADLDVWADDAAADLIHDALIALPAARVQHATDPRRLRHTSYAIETTTGVAVVDVTRGDLMVGPVRLVAEADVTTDDGHLTGIACCADLMVRKLLRGGVPAEARAEQARAAWRTVPAATRASFLDGLAGQLGQRAASTVAQVLESSAAVPPEAAAILRRGLVIATLRPRNVPATWAQRSVVVPAGRRAGLLGLRTRGALVVLVGTDGSGKSTVADELADRLQRLGVRTTTAHLGMARGNLPGVALARRLLGVAPTDSGTNIASTLPTSRADADDAAVAPVESATAAGPPLDHASLRRAAAWFYAVEYGVRWFRDVRPGLRHRGVVIADRYVYDLRESPWPGSRASRAAERTLPRPDVLVLPDAPAELIHARKPERALSEQRDQQERFRALLGEGTARVAQVIVDTSGHGAEDDVARVVAAVLDALHRT